MYFARNWQKKLSNPYVRDLAWALYSANILDHSWDLNLIEKGFPGISEEAFNSFEMSLLSLDKNPEPLKKQLFATPCKRLGDYFERLIDYFLRHVGGCHKIEHSLIMHDGRRTLGEFDFLFFSELLSREIQIEVACKFYLLEDPKKGLSGFLGANPQDSLDQKISKTAQQLALSKRPQVKTMLEHEHLLPIQAAALMKGYLFYPLADTGAIIKEVPPGINENHLFGWWDHISSANWKKRLDGKKFQKLPKLDWLAPRILKDVAETPAENTPSLIAVYSNVDGMWQETERGMLVHKNWPQNGA